MEVNPIQDGAGDAFAVAFDFAGKTVAGFDLGAVITAGTGIGGGDQEKICRVGPGSHGAADGDDAVFQGLSDGFQNVTGKFREFVQKKNAAMGQGNFAGARFGAATDEADAAGGMVRSAEWTDFNN